VAEIQIHPIIRPPAPVDVGHEPHNPVRDDSKTSPNEDLDREPDGVPHSVVGLTAGLAVVVAMLCAFMFLAGGATRIAGIVLLLVATPVLIGSLNKKADRDRDRVHPSR
jgi:hypothetical protein